MRLKWYVQSWVAIALNPRFVNAPLRKLTHSGVIPKLIWDHLPVQATFSVAMPNGSWIKYSSIASDYVGRCLYWRGVNGYEGETTRVFSELAGRAKVVVDVGANSGLYSLLACAANPDATVIALEPVPNTFKRLALNVSLNAWTARCRLLQVAASAQAGAVSFFVPDGGLPLRAVTSEGVKMLEETGGERESGRYITVQAQTVDAICKEIPGVGLVKMDVERLEDAVLAGMEGLLATEQPDIILECVPGSPTKSIEARLARYGYSFYHLGYSGPVRVDTLTPDPREQCRNFLCSVSDEIAVRCL